MEKLFARDKNYSSWLAGLKERIRAAQLKAALTVNRQLLEFYWSLGSDIVEKQSRANWGDKLIERLSRDLLREFPGIKGFSRSNLMYVKKWYLFYAESGAIVQQVVGQFKEGASRRRAIGRQPVDQLGYSRGNDELAQRPVAPIFNIPWGHNIAIISKCGDVEEALYYARCAAGNNWSRSVLVHRIETGAYRRRRAPANNFSSTLPAPQSDLARQALKDPYVFDFLELGEEHTERELETGLVSHFARLLLELGAGFSYLGRQVPVRVGCRDFFMDLLFYHVKLHCYVVVELKAVDFEPEHAGKLNFYLKAVDEKFRTEGDNPAIGILICKNKDKVVVEYALADIRKPIGVADYRLAHTLPKKLRSGLPSAAEMERRLRRGEKG